MQVVTAVSLLSTVSLSHAKPFNAGCKLLRHSSIASGDVTACWERLCISRRILFQSESRVLLSLT